MRRRMLNMNRRTKIMAVLATAALFAMSVRTINTNAAQGAVVIHESGCTLFDGDGGIVSGSSYHAVITPSGNRSIRCSVKGIDNPTGRAIHYDSDNNPIGPGLTCNARGVPTLDWEETISASGNATISCKVN